MIKQIDVDAFVDWRSQIANAGQRGKSDRNQKALETAQYVARTIAALLKKEGNADLYHVFVRIYHGWYRGLTPTDNFRGLNEVLTNKLIPLSIENVAFDWSSPFGGTLLDALDHRKHPRLRIHLPDTLRADLENEGREREKMVDVALACDVLRSTRSDPRSWRIILAEDDDFIPVAFVSEKWAKDLGGKITILRTNPGNRHINLTGILCDARGQNGTS